jgi:hypothetical protein
MPSAPSTRKSSFAVLVNRHVVVATARARRQVLLDVVDDPCLVGWVDAPVLRRGRADALAAVELGELLSAEVGVATAGQAVGLDRRVLVDEPLDSLQESPYLQST